MLFTKNINENQSQNLNLKRKESIVQYIFRLSSRIMEFNVLITIYYLLNSTLNSAKYRLPGL